MMPGRAKAAYKKYLVEPVSIRRITGSGVDRVDASYPTVARIFNTQHKQLTGGIAQQDLTAIVYAQDLFDAGLSSDVAIGDLLVDPQGNEHSVYSVAARRAAGVMVAYELTVRA
jgi:hypothetical protein